MGQALTPQPSPQTKLGPQTLPKKFYIPVKIKFFIASAIALSWFIVSFWLSYPWVLDLSTKAGHLVAWLIVLFIALIPGYLNAFLLASLLLDRPPRLVRPFLGRWAYDPGGFAVDPSYPMGHVSLPAESILRAGIEDQEKLARNQDQGLRRPLYPNANAIVFSGCSLAVALYLPCRAAGEPGSIPLVL